MPAFNGNKPKTPSRANKKVTTHEGGVGYTRNAKLELATLVVTSNLSDSFYEKQNDTISRMQSLVSEIKDHTYLEKLAVAARQVYGMRSSSSALLALMSLIGIKPSKEVVQKVLVRPDDIGNFLAANQALSNKKKVTTTGATLSSYAFENLTERGALRYLGSKKTFSLARALRFSHPVPKDEKQAALFKYLILLRDNNHSHKKAWALLDDKLKPLLPLTHAVVEGRDIEGVVSYQQTRSNALKDSANMTEEDKLDISASAWKSTIGNMMPLAILRNLVNMLETLPNDKEFWDIVISKLQDKDLIARSGVTPVQIYTAFNAIRYDTPERFGVRFSRFYKSERTFKVTPKYLRGLYTALNDAFVGSVSSMPELPGSTLIVADSSGSMTSASAYMGTSGKTDTSSRASCAEIAGVVGVAFSLANPNSTFVSFDTSARVIKISAHVQPLDFVTDYAKGCNGGGTRFNTIQKVVNVGDYENIIVLSDGQFADNPEVAFANMTGKIYYYNLASYSNTIRKGGTKKLVEFGGFTAESMKQISMDNVDLVDFIENYEI